MKIKLNTRQKKIVEIVKNNEPITSHKIAEKLSLTRGALRADLSVLTMTNILKAKPKVGYFYSNEDNKLIDLEKLYGKKVEDIKSIPVVVKEETSVYDAIVTLFFEDVGSLFVIDDQQVLLGIVSRKDLLKVTMGENDCNQIPVSITMTRMPNIITVEREDTILQAAEKIVRYEIDTLPVVETKDNGKVKVVGRISKTDVVRIFVDFY
ncbi:CBS domain-containing protein [Natroniella sulfidigena]|uniref:CBS domain-containing protein n=1 Tax=Natroniella sulfidigena TaxID=723921 RepID=UPI002009EF78|nr:CBS domain-containing protein [Natroniella sulfidigena]